MSKGMLFLYNAIGWITGTMVTYLIIHLVLWLFNKKVSFVRKLAFSVIMGPILENVWFYLVLYIFKIDLFSSLAPILYTLPIPLLVIICYFLGTRLLEISNNKVLRIMTVYYLCYLVMIKFNKFLALMDLSDIAVNSNFIIAWFTFPITIIIILSLLNIFASKILNKVKSVTMSNDEFFFNSKKDILLFSINSFFIYIVTILINLSMESHSLANLLAAIMVSIFLVAYLLMDYKKIIDADNENKSAHIEVLIKGTDEFRSIKHDFYNILQTYDGYLILGDLERLKSYHSNLMHITLAAGSAMELGKKMDQNPALVSLLNKKYEYSEKMNVKMRISTQASFENFKISDIDLCRSLSCLLDNAIEAAAESDDKRVHFSVEQKADGSRLIIITNSTAIPVEIEDKFSFGITTKENHSGIGLATTKKILEKYPHCMFKMSYYNFEVTAYIEIKKL